MSDLLILNTQFMSKRLSIPQHFLYIALYLNFVNVKLHYQENAAVSKRFFSHKNKFLLVYHALLVAKY